MNLQKRQPLHICVRDAACQDNGQRITQIHHSPQEQLAKQECCKCGIKGHLAAECSNRGNSNTSNEWVTDTQGINLPALVSFLKTHDLKENNKYQHLKDELPADVTDIRPYLKHRSEDWKEARKNKLNASKARVLIWHFGLTQAQDYWKSAIQGESIDDNQGFINKLAMGRGTVCENCARVTYYVAIPWL